VPSRLIRSLVTLLALASIVAAGCAASSASRAPSTGASPSSPASSSPATLTETAWTVTSINGAPMVPNAPPTMTFSSDGQVGGSGGCNHYSAPYQTDGGKLTVGPMSSTLMLCEGPVGAQETAFFNGLGGAASWRIGDTGDLEIEGAAKIVAAQGVAASAAPPTQGAALGGTSWNLAEMGGTADFAHIVRTIEFGTDGTVSGFAGCNTFSGTFTTGGTTLTMGPLASTEIGCQRPASAVEAEYLEALSGVTNWEIDANRSLTLGGPVLLRFTSR
jgi:heat shock protein HslJ